MRGISLKLFQGMMILVSVMLALLWLFQVVFLEDFYSARQVGLMADKVTAIGERIVAGGLDDPQVSDEIRELAEVYNSVIGVYDAQEAALVELGRESSGGTGNFYDKHLKAVVELSLRGEPVTRIEEQTRTGGRFLVLARPANDFWAIASAR